MTDADVWTDLSADPLSVADAHAFLLDDRAGGVCVFVGSTRRWTAGEGETARLDYQAHETMARRELRRLAAAAAARWPVRRCVLLHRTGSVAPSEPSVVVGVATPHRTDAFEACRWLIDTLKADLPVWKQEVEPAGGARWVDPQTGTNPLLQ